MGGPWMLYGANGYTGQLIAREAARRGWQPILAGRSREKIVRLANELGLEAAFLILRTGLKQPRRSRV